MAHESARIFTNEERIDAPGVDALRGDAAFWALYESSFSPSSREPAEVIERSIEMGVGMALRAREGGRTVGMATVHFLRAPVVFLVYLAVAPEVRGRGVGAELFRAVVARGEERYEGACGVVWEMDQGDDSEKRLRFYERLGGRVLPVAYVQPPVDGVTVVPMRLMYRGAGEVGEEMVRAIYFEKYGAVNAIAEGVLRGLLDRGA